MSQKPSRLFYILLGWLVLLLSWPASVVLAQDPPPDPVALGAWLYQGQCARCHGPYQQDRVGAGESPATLKSAIESGGCAISWSKKRGGPLKAAEIEALVSYILAWEELGAPPDLPELPPQPTATPQPTPTPANAAGELPTTPTPTPGPVMSPAIEQIVADNPLALGAWLYTHHCYRCHLGYETARMGSAITAETLESFIVNGKTSTQMQAFGRKKGGPLTNHEIETIVLYITTWENQGTAPVLPAELTAPPTPDLAGPIPISNLPAPKNPRLPTRQPVSFARFWPGWPGVVALATGTVVMGAVIALVVTQRD